MKRVVFALAAVVCLHAQTNLVGDWQGTLQAGGVNLRLVLHVVKTEGGLGGTLDSLDQGAFGMKLASVRQDGATLRFELAQPVAQYQGDWNAEAGEFRGNWMQGGASLPLSFKRATASAATAQPIAAEDREFLLGWLQRTGEAYAKALAGVTPAQWRFKARAGPVVDRGVRGAPGDRGGRSVPRGDAADRPHAAPGGAEAARAGR
jgi:hypothetical protein